MRVKINFRIKLIPGQDDLFSQAIFILKNDKALNIYLFNALQDTRSIDLF